MFNDQTTSAQVRAHGSLTQGSHDSDNFAPQTELCTKEHAPHRKIIKQITNTYDPDEGCPFQVKEVFVSTILPLDQLIFYLYLHPHSVSPLVQVSPFPPQPPLRFALARVLSRHTVARLSPPKTSFLSSPPREVRYAAC